MAKGSKTGGREKGTPNKLYQELRSKLKILVESELEMLPENLESLEVNHRVDVLLKLIPFVLPKVNPISMKDGEPIDYDISIY